MFKWMFAPIFRSEPAEFRSDYSIDKSVSRLRGHTRRTIFSNLFRVTVVGKVQQDSVRLQRAIPFLGSIFKPFFFGKFINREGAVVLNGKFAIHFFEKLFMTVWIGFALAWTMFSCLLAIGWLFNPNRNVDDPSYWFPFMGVAFVIVGRYFVKFCWWLSSGDIKYLSRVIQDSLSSDVGPVGPNRASAESGHSIGDRKSPNLIARH